MLQISAEHEAAVQELQIAFEDEANAQARYVAFASKANDEGLLGAASLFRAAARAEHIHAASHAWVMSQFGQNAHCAIHPFQPKSTLENLKEALAGERLEVDSLYPDCLKEVAACNILTATRTFTRALEAEKTHALLFEWAIAHIEDEIGSSPMAAPRDFFVCPGCGLMAAELDEDEDCSVCNSLRDRFETVR